MITTHRGAEAPSHIGWAFSVPQCLGVSGSRQLALVAGAIFCLATAAPDASGQDLRLVAASASAGVVKAERWTPVLVTIDSSRASLTGTLLVTWGDARVLRDVELPSPGRRQFEIYIRTSNPADRIRVALVSPGADSAGEPVASAEVPVRVLPPHEPLTLCVLAAGGTGPDTACTASLASDLLPASPRGYEAVDEVVWASEERHWSVNQRTAFERWRALRTLERSGDLGLAPQPSRPSVRRGLSAGVVRPIAVLAIVYAAALILIGWSSVSRRSRVMMTALCALAAVVGASTVAHMAGGIGPRPPIVVHHATVLQQIPGTQGAIVAMRGVLEFPAFDEFRVRLPFPDGAIEAASTSGRSEQTIDAGGFPVISGTYGLGARRAFVAEAFVDLHPLGVTMEGDDVTVRNRSTSTLRDCRFGDGFSVGEAGLLSPGASASARRVANVIGPMFTCKADVTPWNLTSEGRAVEAQGVTIITAYDTVARATGGVGASWVTSDD